MENNNNEKCIAACQKCVGTCTTCATENEGKAGMDDSVKICIACKDACNELIAASKTGVNLEEYYKKCEAACLACATECEKHVEMHHCEECAEACRKCAEECKAMLTEAA